ncbi:potassium channel protein [Robertkochia marina]|uniref:Potassium channel protein n=1 Tax=Robertkochia marina TaxID=1227945 RepID=A0A4S3LYA2_9FLAO|nr:potassium channel protein [Robertkochia marina]THD66406.1 potassium channel protein [Robertkochia marina]TRZ44085.1 potassium channel protein [Robertkochia marina]
MFQLFRSKFYTALALLLVVLTGGTLGYRLISGYDWIDALYMTVITVTTVGFREVHPTDTVTKLFTIVLIILSVFIFAYSISVITEYILSRSTFQNIKFRKMKKQLEQMQGHIIICGFGRNGQQAAAKLKAYRRPFVVIEQDEELIDRHAEDIIFVHGDANEDEVLLEAGIERAKSLITALPNDSDNLFVVLSSRQLNKDLSIISRAANESTVAKLRLAGADKTIMPDKIGGDHMASLVVLPDLVEFLDQLSIDGENSINLEEIAIDDLSDQFANCSIRDLDIRQKSGCTVIGYKSPSGEYIINPEADTKLMPHTKIVVLGRPEQINKLNKIIFKS